MKDVKMEHLQILGKAPSLTTTTWRQAGAPLNIGNNSIEANSSESEDAASYTYGQIFSSVPYKSNVVRRIEYVNQMNNKLLRKDGSGLVGLETNGMNAFILVGKGVPASQKYLNNPPNSPMPPPDNHEVQLSVVTSTPKTRIKNNATTLTRNTSGDFLKPADNGALTLPALSFGTTNAQYTPGPPGTPAYKMAEPANVVKEWNEKDALHMTTSSKEPTEALFQRTNKIPRFPIKSARQSRPHTQPPPRDVSDLKSCLQVSTSDDRDLKDRVNEETRLRSQTQFVQRHTYLSDPYRHHNKRLRGLPKPRQNYKFDTVKSYHDFNKCAEEKDSSSAAYLRINKPVSACSDTAILNGGQPILKLGDPIRQEDFEESGPRNTSRATFRSGTRSARAIYDSLASDQTGSVSYNNIKIDNNNEGT